MTSTIDNRTTELLQELRDLAKDINPNEIIDHVSIMRMGWTFDAQWLNAWHTEFNRIMQAVTATLENDTQALERENVKLHKQMDELINAVNELQKKQPYCYDPDNPIDTLNTIGCYIDELKQLVWYMWREITTCPDYQVPPCMTPNICNRIRELEIYCDSSKFDAEAETISTENTCTAKICEVEETFTEPVTLDYIQEYRCHRCGEYSYMQILYSEDKINYCSHCGAKVIY